MDFIGGISGPSFILLSVEGIFKILFLILVLGYVMYNIFLALRVRILHDTLKNKAEGMTLALSYLNLVITLIGGLVVVILILVG